MTVEEGKHTPDEDGSIYEKITFKPLKEWSRDNRNFFFSFRAWMKSGNYSKSTIHMYSAAVVQALGLLNKPYWRIDPDADLEWFSAYLETRPIRESTRIGYRKGIKKLDEFLRLRCHKEPKRKAVNWDYYVGGLPDWLVEKVKAYIGYRQRRWQPDERYRGTLRTLSCTTAFLRYAAKQAEPKSLMDLKVSLWQSYVVERLGAGIQPVTINGELSAILSLLRFHQELGRKVNAGLLCAPRLRQKQRRLDNVPIDQLRELLAEMDRDIERDQAKLRYMALMDKSATLLMLHCGLRSGEVRRLKLGQIDWQGRKLRIEQSKGLKDRMVYISQAVIEALKAYLEFRGTPRTFPGEVFIYRSKPLSSGYLYGRLRSYGERCGVQITPHQLRHSNATLLSQAGATSASVQAILGHRWMSTTMRYMRLQKPMMAAAYYAAMVFIEKRIQLPEDENAAPPSAGQLLALVDYLQMSALDQRQTEIVGALQEGLLSIARGAEHQHKVEDQNEIGDDNKENEWNREFY